MRTGLLEDSPMHYDYPALFVLKTRMRSSQTYTAFETRAFAFEECWRILLKLMPLWRHSLTTTYIRKNRPRPYYPGSHPGSNQKRR
jgi:hypothetical protein